MDYQVRIGKLPGTVREVTIIENSTIGELLGQVDLDADGFEIRLNGDISTLNTPVHHGDTVLLVRKIQGNSTNRV